MDKLVLLEAVRKTTTPTVPIENIHEYLCPKILCIPLQKKVVALQMFSSPMNDEKLHILLVGEIGTGKSKLIKDAAKVIPRGSYASSDLSKVGLREKLIFSSNSTLGIDEFDKLKKPVKNGLLEVMETGELTIDKHRTHKIVEAKTNIICACNPDGESFNSYMPISDQIRKAGGLALTSRFHLIVPFYPVDSDLYGNIALGFKSNPSDDENRRRKLREYITRVKEEYPIISIPDDILIRAGNLVKMYKQMSNYRETITPRLIEGIISILKANARMKLSDTVTEDIYNETRQITDKLYLDI